MVRGILTRSPHGHLLQATRSHQGWAPYREVLLAASAQIECYREGQAPPAQLLELRYLDRASNRRSCTQAPKRNEALASCPVRRSYQARRRHLARIPAVCTATAA